MISLIVAMWVAHLADVLTTVYGLGRGCVEMNPLYGLGGWPLMVGVKVGGLVMWSCWLMESARRHRRWKTLLLWAGLTSVGAGAAMWNLWVIPTCGW